MAILRCYYEVRVTNGGTKVFTIVNDISGFSKVVVDGTEANLGVWDKTITYTCQDDRIHSFWAEYTLKDEAVIGEFAFKGISILKKIELPDTVTTIERSAFNTTGLAGYDLTIPDTVETIGDYAFYGGVGYNLTLGSGVKTIGDYAFCSSTLVHIISNAVTPPEITKTSFKNVTKSGLLEYPEGSDYSSWLRTDEFYLGYYGWNREIPEDMPVPEVPDVPEIEDDGDYKPVASEHLLCVYNVVYIDSVVTLCDYATFWDKMIIDGVEVEPTKEYVFTKKGYHYVEFVRDADYYIIPIGMFKNAYRLISVTAPDGITKIDSSSFYGCYDLIDVDFNSDLQVIGDNAFYGCTNLKSIPVAKTIGKYAFGNCTELPNSLTIPDGVETIGERAFDGCAITTLTLPDSVQIIDKAFCGCTELTAVKMGSGITSMYGTFEGCDSLYEIEITAPTAPAVNGNTFLDVRYGGTLYHPEGSDYSSWFKDYPTKDLGYYIWNALTIEEKTPTASPVVDKTEVDIGKGGGRVVYNVTIPKDVVDWTAKIYSPTNKWVTVLLKELVEIDVEVDRYKLSVIVDDNTGTFRAGNIIFKFYKTDGTTVNINTYIRQASYWDYELPYVLGTFTTTEDNAKADILPYSNDGIYVYDVLLDGVSIIRDIELGKPQSSSASQGWYYYVPTAGEHTLKYIFKKGTTELLKGVFPYSMDTIVISDYFQTIGDYAFYPYNGGAGIKNLSLGNGIRVIGSAAFAKNKFKSVIIPDSVTTVNGSAFGSCEAMETVVIGSGCKEMKSSIFSNCSSLTSIITYANEAPVTYKGTGNETWTFRDVPYNGVLYYPEGSDYSSWLTGEPYDLRYYNWNAAEIKSDKPENPTEPEVVLWLELDEINAPMGGYTVNLDSVLSGIDEVKLIAPEWVIVANKGNYFEIEVLPNESGIDRVGEVIVVGNPNNDSSRVQQNIIINQTNNSEEMATSIAVYKMRLDYPSTGGAGYVQVDYINPKEINEPTCSQEWVSITRTQSGTTSNGNDTVIQHQYRITMAETNMARSINVVFSCTDMNDRLVTQNKLFLYQEAPVDEPVVDEDAKVDTFTTRGTIKADGTPEVASLVTIRCGYNSVVISTPYSEQDWIHLGNGTMVDSVFYGYDTVMEYPITFDANAGAARTGVVVFRGYDNAGQEITSTAVFTQLAPEVEPEKPDVPESTETLTYSPIWKDVGYRFNSDTTYEIYTPKSYKSGNGVVWIDELVFRARAYVSPDTQYVDANINKVCQNYMEEAMNIFDGAVGYNHSYKEFKLKNENGDLLHTYRFVNDWSYNELHLGLKTNPICPYIAQGQKLFFSVFATDRKEIKWGMRYSDGTEDYDNTEYVSNEFFTNMVADTKDNNVKTFYFGDKTYTALPKCRCKYVLYYLNPYGGFDWFPVTGKVTRRDKIEAYTVTQNFSNTTANFGKKRYLSTINTTYQINTQWLSQEQSDRMWELIESNVVWLHSLEDDKIMPVIITDTEVEHKMKTRKQKLLSYQFNAELSQVRERL